MRGHVPAWRLMLVYSITEGFSPILCCRPDVITLGNPFDTRVPDYSSSSFFVFFPKMKRKLSPPSLRPSSKLGVPDYSSSESLRAQCGEDVVGRRNSGPTVYRATSGRLAYREIA